MIGAATARTGETRQEGTRATPVVEFETVADRGHSDRTGRFYSKRPAVLYGGRLDDAARSVAGIGYEFFKIKRVADDHLLLRDEAGNDRRLAEPPLQLAGIFGFDQGEFDLVARAADWLRRRRPHNVPEPILLDGADTASLAAALLTQAQLVLRQQAEMTTALARQLADARQSNEDLQNRFAALEIFIDRHGLQPFERAFINEPAHDDSDPNALAANVLAMAANGRIAQILPVASLGVSAVAFHVARPAPRSDATLVVSLTTIEDGTLVESWTVPAGELPAGWTTLSLRQAIAGLRRTLRLVISVEGARTDLPFLSLGGAQPLDLFRLQDHDLRQSMTSASLALQVFVGLPGVVPPSPGGFTARSGEDNKGGLRERSLDPDLLRDATQVRLDSDTSGFDGVSYLEDERIVSCHPPAFGMTVAKIPGGCPAGTLRLSANLLVDHAKSRDVEFALVAGNDESRILHLLGGVAEPVTGEGFSGWTRVPAKQPRFASLYIDGAAGGASDLYLATRMVEPGNHDFAWARFLNLHALIQG